MTKITTFLMFEGQAEEAMNYYMSLFDNARVLQITRNEGKIVHATFTLNGQEFMCIDSNIKHGFTFTPAMSLYVTCDTEEEVDRLFEGLTQGGNVLMPLAEYPFSKKYGWLSDRFGVSWQLSLKEK